MQRGCLLLAALVLAAYTAHAQPIPASGPKPASFVPRGYKMLDGPTMGDLNGDGRPDAVLALAPLAEDTTQEAESLPPRLLLVLWRTAAGGYQLACAARKVLLCKSCGGVFGDPYASLDIKKGVLTVYHYGGSNWRWSIQSKFRYQQGGFYLIGERYADQRITEECPHLEYPPNYTFRDTNFLTGSFEVIRTSGDCKLLEHRRGHRKVQPLKPLATYEPQS